MLSIEREKTLYTMSLICLWLLTVCYPNSKKMTAAFRVGTPSTARCIIVKFPCLNSRNTVMRNAIRMYFAKDKTLADIKERAYNH